jgi:TBC1 domain family protein 5
MERDISQYSSRDKILGESLAWIVDALLQDESEVKEVERVKLQKREALESLSYVRDVLMTNITTLDDDRLIGGEEKERRKAKAKKERDDLKVASVSAVVAPPAPVPVADSHVKQTNHHRVVQPQSPPLPSPSSILRSNERAPWNYTRSSFSTPTSTLPVALMPRPPPPTSTSLRREEKLARDQTPTKTEGYQDPLGALR